MSEHVDALQRGPDVLLGILDDPTTKDQQIRCVQRLTSFVRELTELYGSKAPVRRIVEVPQVNNAAIAQGHRPNASGAEG